MTIRPGLCSITLRQLDVDQVVDTAYRAGAEAIEWGSDVHIPAGDLAAARHAADRCNDAGLVVASYGSYLGMADDDLDPDAADAVFGTASALGAPLVRIWTPLGITPDAAPHARARVADRTAAIAAAAADRGLLVALEFHPGTLTETAWSTMNLLDEIAAPNLLTHWQPDPSRTADENLSELRTVIPKLAHLHVFNWGPGGIGERRPLATGDRLWPPALLEAADAPRPTHLAQRYALCEYVVNDEPAQLTADLETLRHWLAVTMPGFEGRG